MSTPKFSLAAEERVELRVDIWQSTITALLEQRKGNARIPYESLLGIIDPSPNCWVWPNKPKHGYGQLFVDQKWRIAHRWVYELLVGPIPTGLVLDHLCRNTICVNPRHLEPVTQRENMLRSETPVAQRAAQTHCVNGHEFTPGNTIVRARKGGGRQCRQCTYEGARERYRLRAALEGPA